MIKRIKSEYAETTQVRLYKSLNGKGDLKFEIFYQLFNNVVRFYRKAEMKCLYSSVAFFKNSETTQKYDPMI